MNLQAACVRGGDPWPLRRPEEGKDSFGHVQLVQHRKTGATYALKAVNKAQIVATGQQGHVVSEKRVMAQLRHPFLVNLHATCKDKDRLFFLLEVVQGGELFSVLREKTLFVEEVSRFYAASVLLAFEYMHSMNIVYRDLKYCSCQPENGLQRERGVVADSRGSRSTMLCSCARWQSNMQLSLYA